MSMTPQGYMRLGVAGLAAALALAVYFLQADVPPDTARTSDQWAACSSCEARNAHLRDMRNAQLEAKK